MRVNRRGGVRGGRARDRRKTSVGDGLEKLEGEEDGPACPVCLDSRAAAIPPVDPEGTEDCGLASQRAGPNGVVKTRRGQHHHRRPVDDPRQDGSGKLTFEAKSSSIKASSLDSHLDSAIYILTMSATTSAAAGPSSAAQNDSDKALSVLVIGMAGSGKSTFAGALSRHLSSSSTSADGSETTAREKDAYLVNLDPAVGALNYEPNVDIRDTIDYKRVMEEYNLGPNGGILTALNLFTTKFDQVLSILERRSTEVDHIVLDTPGQIEIFTWSASGTIITDSLASAMPTCVAYVIDTPRTTAPATFMSNMLYACSIMYKTKLPFVLVFNKTDLQSHDFALEWMADFEAFQAALSKGNATDQVDVTTRRPVGGRISGAMEGDGGEGGSYMNSLMNSMALVLDEFYQNIRAVGVSSTTGEGMTDLVGALNAAREEYEAEYKPELERIRNMKKAKEEGRKKAEVAKMMKDLRVSHSTTKKPPTQQQGSSSSSRRTAAEVDDDDDVEDPRVTAMLTTQQDLDPDYDASGQVMDPDEPVYISQSAAQGQAGQQRSFDHLSREEGAWHDGSNWPQGAQ